MEENDLINDFLQGKLGGEDLEKLKALLKDNPELSRQVEEEIELKHGLIYANRLAMKERFDALDKARKEAGEGGAGDGGAVNAIQGEDDSETKVVSFPYLRVAASVVAILALGYGIWNSMSGPNYQRLAGEYYEELATLEVSFRGLDDEKIIDAAFEDYKNGEYALAREKLADLSSITVYQAYGSFVKGLIWMEEKDYEKALASFDQALQVDNLKIESNVYWYSALCYLQLEEIDLAKELLNDLLQTEEYSERSKELLNKL